MVEPLLLDDHSRPDFRDVFEFHTSNACAVDTAIHRIRLSGITLTDRNIGHVRRIRVMIGETNALTLASEADSLALDPGRRDQLRLLISMIAEGRLHIRIAPMAGWNPDFSVFYCASEGTGAETAPTRPSVLMLGLHRFQRPYVHPGPALAVVLGGEPALQAHRRFKEIWPIGHDLRLPVYRILRAALDRTGVRVDEDR